MKTGKRLLLASMLFVIACVFSSCAEPGARTRVDMINHEYDGAPDLAVERNLGREVASGILGNFPVLGDEALTRYVNMVGLGLALHGPRGELNYRFAVLDEAEPNAFSAPGGYIFITKGALGLMRDESELAAVLAHEIAHVNNLDILRELKVGGSGNKSFDTLAQLIGGTTKASLAALAELTGTALDVLLKRGYKVEDEYKADRAALELMALVGYDVTALGRYLARVESARNPSAQTSLIKTHPANAERTNKIAAWISESGLAGTPGGRNEKRFGATVKLL